jgi:hypothetical protein
MRLKKSAEPPVCHYGSNKPTRGLLSTLSSNGRSIPLRTQKYGPLLKIAIIEEDI